MAWENQLAQQAIEAGIATSPQHQAIIDALAALEENPDANFIITPSGVHEVSDGSVVVTTTGTTTSA